VDDPPSCAPILVSSGGRPFSENQHHRWRRRAPVLVGRFTVAQIVKSRRVSLGVEVTGTVGKRNSASGGLPRIKGPAPMSPPGHLPAILSLSIRFCVHSQVYFREMRSPTSLPPSVRLIISSCSIFPEDDTKQPCADRGDLLGTSPCPITPRIYYVISNLIKNRRSSAPRIRPS
jgi:hypothetical protein